MFVDGKTYLSLPRSPQQWVIEHLIPVGGLTNMYGKPKAGKSFAALGMAHAISTGAPDWLGFAVQTHGPVAYLQIDTPRGEWAGSRVNGMDVMGMDVTGIKFCDMDILAESKKFPFDILEADKQKWLQEQLALVKPVVVFIDTIRELHGADENDSTAMRNVITNMVAACRPAAIVILSHSRKDSMFTTVAGEDLMSDARGSSYISGRMDVVIRMSTDGKHATAMTYRGRSVGQGRIAVTQDEIGLIQLDGAESAYWDIVRKTATKMFQENPTGPVSAIAEAIEAQTTRRKNRQIRTDVETHLVTLGWEKPKRKRTAK